MDEQLDQLVAAHRILARAGQGDLVWGHISLRDEGGRGVWMKRAGLGMEEVGREELLLVDDAGDIFEGSGPRHSEYPLHTQVMAARPDVNCVVHTHAHEVLAFAAVDEPLRPLSHEATLFVPPGLRRFDDTPDLVRDDATGARVAEALGDARALVLRQHGVLVVGEGVAEATVAALLLASACRLQLDVLACGRPYSYSDDAEALAKRDHVYSSAQLRSAFDYLARVA